MLTSCHPKRGFSNLYWIRWICLLMACLFLFVVVFLSNVFYDSQTKYDIHIDAPSPTKRESDTNNNGVAIANNATSAVTATRTKQSLPPPRATKKKKIKLFQAINTFAINKDKTNNDDGSGNGNPTIYYQPYDQWSTLASIQRAKQQYAARSLVDQNLEITLVCAMFESDERILVANDLLQAPCDYVSRLERSTVTEYGNGNRNLNSNSNSNETLFSEVFSKRELPFLQDLLDAAVSVARNEKTNHNTAGNTTAENNNSNDEDDADDFYVMLTNSDIGLTKDFYSFLLPLLEEEQKAYTINRWSIPMDGKSHPISIRKPTNDPQEIEKLLTQIDASLVTGMKHPGYDCFIIHSSIIDKISLGTMYMGFPPWGSALQIMLKDIVAKNAYKQVRSTPNATFHLGGKGTWSNKKKDATAQTVLKYIKERYKEDIADCPKSIFAEDPHTVMNAAICGRVFREDYNRHKSRRKGTKSKRLKRRKQNDLFRH